MGRQMRFAFDSPSAAEIAIVSDPSQWPFDSVLPLAHRRELENGLPALGVLLRGDLESGCDGGRPRVYLGELVLVLQRLNAGKPVRTRCYDSWPALLADWRVD